MTWDSSSISHGFRICCTYDKKLSLDSDVDLEMCRRGLVGGLCKYSDLPALACACNGIEVEFGVHVVGAWMVYCGPSIKFGGLHSQYDPIYQ